MAPPNRAAATAFACAAIVALPTAGASADEAVRGRYELEVHLGAAVPLPCQACRGVSAGPTAGMLLLWRPSPHFAIGPMAEYASLAWHAAWGDFDDPHARVRSALVGLAARYYLRKSGPTEPYLEGATGWQLLGSTARPSPGATFDGPFVQTVLGHDFYVHNELRFAPSLAFTYAVHGGGGPDIGGYFAPPTPGLTGMIALRLGVTWAMVR